MRSRPLLRASTSPNDDARTPTLTRARWAVTNYHALVCSPRKMDTHKISRTACHEVSGKRATHDVVVVEDHLMESREVGGTHASSWFNVETAAKEHRRTRTNK